MTNHGSVSANSASYNKAKDAHVTTMVWMNKYLNNDANTPLYNTNYPHTFDEIIWEYVVGENMTILI